MNEKLQPDNGGKDEKAKWLRFRVKVLLILKCPIILVLESSQVHVR